MLLVLPLQFAQMRVEAIETLLLKDPAPHHPRRRIAEPSRLEACGPPLRVAPARDEAGVLVTTRVFDPPAERVYKAWTEPKQLAVVPTTTRLIEAPGVAHLTFRVAKEGSCTWPPPRRLPRRPR